MLGRVQRPSAYVSAMIGNGVVAVSRAVADDGWAGVFGVATLPHPRMNLVICPWRTTGYDLGVLDALVDLPA
jgi:hypothetical protein